ncbi:uncharacterized protein FA14DRAFT_153163 [Meira miltonrushii]|uniref:Uncharacterized protein n=1 Tax=Meira miltonrushii TaxID=1280837 RepID=A0A316VJE9_9BASI|nr:uncharacterized protein FA14DRAFT_153163 [Meira miltonrushii]PWN37807.1 hypothetical protein FA14DRAFT_153163 [Meira miltonrushii]
MAPRSAQRDYATVISESPVRHAIFNKPFSSLRRKTENLLDQITGGTIPTEIEEEVRREKERKRESTCRFCRLCFADQRGLSKHYDLFPAHLREERKKPERKTTSSTIQSPPVQPSLPRHDTVPRMSNSNSRSTSTINDTFAVGPLNRQASLQRSKARSQPDIHANFVPSSRPSPSRSPIPANVPQSPPLSSSYIAPSSPLSSQTSSRLASDFYASSQNINSPLFDLGVYTSTPYTVPNAMASAPTIPDKTTGTNPHAAAMLPEFDFENKFTRIPREGIPEPSKAKQVHRPDPSKSDFMADRNREAGVRSARRIDAKYQNAVNDNARYLPHRGASESDALSINTAVARQGPAPFPNSFNGIVRAIAATGADDGSPAVLPTQAMSTFEHKRSNTWAPLAGEEDVPVPTSRSRSRTASTNGRQWGSLMEALPGSPAREKKSESPFKELEPVKTGMTSFSDHKSEEPSSSGNASPITTRSRRNTNPFLNRDFMKSIPNALKTPPLSPSSPWGNGSASPGNPFKQLVDDDDDLGFFDAPSGPKTPADEINKLRSAKSSNAINEPLAGSTQTVPGAF